MVGKLSLWGKAFPLIFTDKNFKNTFFIGWGAYWGFYFKDLQKTKISNKK